jgi:ABC-type transport system substrate-binding protein/methyl-accepting chemotaxis protein
MMHCEHHANYMASTTDKNRNETTASKSLPRQSAAASSRKNQKASRNGDDKDSNNRRTEQLAAALANGDLATEFAGEAGGAETGAVGELRALARNMRRAVGRLKRAADSIETTAGRVLEGGRVLALAVSDEAQSIESAVSSIAEITASAGSVAEAVGALSNLAQTTSVSSLEMAASIDEVSSSADALALFVEETASSIEEMAASVRGVAASTESLSATADQTERSMRAIDESTRQVGISVSETAALADEVQRVAEQGSAIVAETAESMRATRHGIEEAAETIAALGERSERIGAITRVIDEIADRTNLLALNARILAAQAGQQGRGFAVVAEEIKELSERTARSTEEIDELIKGVRESVGAAMAQASNNRQLADAGVNLAERAASSLDEISTKTSQSALATRQIAEAAATQSLESHQVTQLVTRVRRRMEEIERATSEQASTAASIGERAVRMAELTQQVRRAMQEQAEASKHIAEGMEQLTEFVGQISGAVGEQHRGAEDALHAVERISEAVRRNQASIVQINYTASLLNYEAALLHDSVGSFKMPEPSRGGHLVYGVPSRIPSLDVLESSTLTRADQLSLIVEGLVGAGAGAEVVPLLAERWDISADGRTYTFHLRQGVRFHNGRTMEAADVLYSIRRTLRHSQSGAWVFMSLMGAREFAVGETEELAGVRMRDAHTIELELEEPLAFFLPMLCLRFASILPREEVERDGGRSFIERPIGTGAFRVVGLDTAAGKVELARFDDYWREGRPYVDRVTVEYNENSDELLKGLRSGRLAFLRQNSFERIKEFAADPIWRSCTVLAPQLHTQCLIFDAEQEPFDDVRVRRAVAHAINKDELIRDAYGEMAVAAAGPIPPGLMGHNENHRGLEYDPELARRLMREAGYRSKIKLELWRTFPEHAASERAAKIICQNLEEIGIECALRLADTSELVEAALSGEARLAELSWYADYADPDNFTYVLFNSSNPGIGRTARVPEIDRMSARARTLVNPAERAKLYAELQRMIAEEALCAFLTHRRTAIIHRPDVENLHAHLVQPVVRPQEIWLNNNG